MNFNYAISQAKTEYDVTGDLEDLQEKGRRWLREYNNFPMRPLKWLSPIEKLQEYQGIQNVK